MNIELHIEELALHGFDPAARYRIGDALTRELQRLLAEHGTTAIFKDSVDIAEIDAGTFNLKPNADSETIGAQIARAIYGGISR